MNPRFVAKSALVALSAALLTACASGYSQFYTPVTGSSPERIAANRAAPAPAQPIVERMAAPGSDAETMVNSYAKRGYVLIGHVNFNSGRGESEAAAVQQGQKVGADLVVIFHPRYTGSQTSMVPLTLPTTSTTYSTGTATAFGQRGAVTAYGSGTSTTYGTTTTMIPTTVHRSDYGAAYFVKWKFAFGARLRPLNDAERQALQTNKGVAVNLVVDHTAAYKADILAGDIITAVDGQPVEGLEDFARMTRPMGQTVNVSLNRNGSRLDKKVTLPQQ